MKTVRVSHICTSSTWSAVGLGRCHNTDTIIGGQVPERVSRPVQVPPVGEPRGKTEGGGDFLYARALQTTGGTIASQTEPESDPVAFGPGPAKKSFLRRPCTIPGLSGWVQVFNTKRLAKIIAGEGRPPRRRV